MQVCFFCGAANSPGSPECHSCGQPLPGGGEPPPSEPVAASVEPSNPPQASASTDGTEPLDPDALSGEVKNCPFCDATVPVETTKCPHCQLNIDAKDPLNLPAPRGHENDLTHRYDDFAKQVEAVRLGSIQREDFSTWLKTIKGKLEGQRNNYMEMIRDSGYYDHHSDEVDLGLTGILDFEEAMEAMGAFANGDAEQSILDAALLLMWEGNEKLNEAMRLNRNFRAQLEEDWGYM